jgi:ABC-type sugar transport system ATPase subunit
MIRLENIGKSYDGGKTFAVRNINLTIEKGDFVALLGPSGCGKSTTLMMLCGLYRPTEGSIYFNGRYVNNIMPKDRNIGMVFQSYALYPNMSIFENIAFPLRQMKMKKQEITERVEKVADVVKISDYLKRMPAQLSGGQQQRCAIARALIKNPKLLLCDEPTGALDSNTSRDILMLLEEVNAKYNTTMIIVTHNNSIKNMVHKVIFLKDGLVKDEYINEHRVSASELEDL